MKGMIILALLSCAAPFAFAEDGAVELRSPGLAPSHVDGEGRLVEDWGVLSFRLEGEALGEAKTKDVSPLTLDEVIPAARIAWRHGPVAVSAVAYRVPAWPAGIDLVTVRLEETKGDRARGSLVLSLPEGARIGGEAVFAGSRRILALPERARAAQEMRPWGYLDEAQALPGWATPKSGFDPAFANIRAGMGGVSILYRFAAPPSRDSNVVLGFCESYWSSAGSRFMSCKVEGAGTEIVDPLARWGRHQPGGALFEGSDTNGDGWLEVLVLPGPGTPDLNPILNAIWVFEPGLEIDPGEVITGRMNAFAERYVDVGGEQDQPIVPGGKLEYAFLLEPGGTEEYVFLAACSGGSAPEPGKTAWTPEALRKAAREVWLEWPGD
jgi:hypothetical protein